MEIKESSLEIEKPANRIGPQFTWKKKLLFSFILLTLTLVFAEVSISLLRTDVNLKNRSRNGSFVVPFLPNTEGDIVSYEYTSHYMINEWGHRDKRGRSVELPKGQKRILVLGDSFSEGMGVQVEERYSNLVEKQFQCEVWNSAQQGRSPAFYVFQWNYLAPLIKPSCVVIQIFDNDVLENYLIGTNYYVENSHVVAKLPEKFQRPASPFFELRNYVYRLSLHQGYSRLKRQWKTGEKTARLFVKTGTVLDKKNLVVNSAGKVAARTRFLGWAVDNAKESDWAPRFVRQDAILRQLIGSIQGKGIPVVLAYIPHPYLFEKWTSLRELREKNPHFQLLEKLCKELKVPFVDCMSLQGAMTKERREGNYYPIDGHWNKTGHAWFADILSKQLERLLPDLKKAK